METSRRSERLPEPSPVGSRIYTIRGQSVMLDSDLAEVYGVLTKNLNKAVSRNPDRFPEEFTFQLSQDEWDALRFQFGTLNAGRGRHRKYLPYAFTEHGAIMLASVLNSPFAVRASIVVVQAFVRLRHILDASRELSRRIDELNAQFEKKSGEDAVRFHAIFQELKRLALGTESEEAKPKDRIGFKPNKERGISGKKKRGTS